MTDFTTNNPAPKEAKLALELIGQAIINNKFSPLEIEQVLGEIEKLKVLVQAKLILGVPK